MFLKNINKKAYIKCTKGDIEILSDYEIAGLEIRFSGEFILDSNDPDNCIVAFSNNRLIAVGLTGKLPHTPFLKYVGNPKIIEALIVFTDLTTTMAIIKSDKKDLFTEKIDNFSNSSENFEDLNNLGVVGKKVYGKSRAIFSTKNLKAEKNQYTLDGIDYEGDFHLNSNGIPMTESTPSKNSKKLQFKKSSEEISQRARQMTIELKRNMPSQQQVSKGGY